MNEEIEEYKIQVPSSILFAREDIEKYKIQIPTSMTILQKPLFYIISPCMYSNPRCPSKGVWGILYYDTYVTAILVLWRIGQLF